LSLKRSLGVWILSKNSVKIFLCMSIGKFLTTRILSSDKVSGICPGPCSENESPNGSHQALQNTFIIQLSGRDVYSYNDNCNYKISFLLYVYFTSLMTTISRRYM
jgi:hypothetical protein